MADLKIPKKILTKFSPYVSFRTLSSFRRENPYILIVTDPSQQAVEVIKRIDDSMTLAEWATKHGLQKRCNWMIDRKENMEDVEVTVKLMNCGVNWCYEGWESLPLGHPICQDDPGFTNCAFSADSPKWHATVYHPENLNVGDPMEYLDVISKNSGKQLKITTTIHPWHQASGVLNGYLSIPVTEATEIFFEGHESVLSDPNAYVSIQLAYGGTFQYGDPCKGKVITYVFEHNSLPAPTDSAKLVIIGRSSSFRRKILQDLECSPSEFIIGGIHILINNTTSTNNWATWDSIGIRDN